MVLHKVLKYLVLLLSLIAMGFFFYTLALGDEAIELNTEGSQAVTVSPLIYLAYISLALIAVIVVIFVFKGLFSSAEVLKKSLISVGLLAVVALISYFVLADDSVLDASGKVIELEDGELLTAGTSQWIGASLYMFYILGVVAVGTIVWAGVSKLIKK
ncbi:hypothetical protein [Nonlabens sp.]|uniref:hypothetical protein n=1 Tax=Nonlabens TaxID=363408 RepID=UPI003266B23C